MKLKFLFVVAFSFFFGIVQAQWVKASGLSDIHIQTVESLGALVFAGSASQGVWRSGDNGVSWTNKINGLTNTDVRAIATGPGIVYAGTAAGVFISYNNGDTWSAANTGLGNMSIRSLATTGGSVFAGTENGLYVSDDQGTLWKQVTNKLPANLGPVNAIAVYSSTMYVSTELQGLFEGINAANFADIYSGIPDICANSVVKLNGNLFMGTKLAGMYSSNNGGAIWSTVTTGIPANSIVKDIYEGSNYLFASANKKVYASKDNGLTWSEFSEGLDHFDVRNFNWNGAWIYLANYESGVWRRPITEGGTIDLQQHFLENGATLFPNPCHDVLNVVLPNSEGTLKEIAVYDLQGRSVKNETFETTDLKLSIANLAPGLYLYQIKKSNALIAVGKINIE